MISAAAPNIIHMDSVVKLVAGPRVNNFRVSLSGMSYSDGSGVLSSLLVEGT